MKTDEQNFAIFQAKNSRHILKFLVGLSWAFQSVAARVSRGTDVIKKLILITPSNGVMMICKCFSSKFSLIVVGLPEN